MKKTLQCTLFISLLSLGLAFTAPVQTYSVTSSEVVLSSPSPIRYRFDNDAKALILEDLQPTQTLMLPPGIGAEVKGRDTYIYLSPQAQFGLLSDGQRLRITLPDAQSSAVTSAPALPSTGAEPTAAVAPVPSPNSPEALLAKTSSKNTLPPLPRLIRLENAKPKIVADLLSKFFPRALVDIDERQNAVLVTAPADVQLQIDQTVKMLDVDRPQVMFEAEVLEVNRDATQSLGIDYDSIFTFKFLEDTPRGLFKLGKVSRASGLSLNLGINALKNSGAAKVLAQPRITTLDGVEAVINSTQSTPIVITGTQTGSIQTITTGITMRLTPRVTPSGLIEADMVISVSSPTGTTSSGIPQFSSREARTTVRVGNGEPIAIGGLIEDRQLNNEQKVPILGDIPLIGKLFTKTRTEQVHSDLVIVVTPRLILPNSK